MGIRVGFIQFLAQSHLIPVLTTPPLNVAFVYSGPVIPSIAFLVIRVDPFSLFQQWKSCLDPTHEISILVKFHTHEKVIEVGHYNCCACVCMRETENKVS